MARPKSPKKNGSLQETPGSRPTTPEVGVAPAEAGSVVLASAENTKTEVKKTTRKPEILKTQLRASLVPVDLDGEIRSLAYLISERRGFEPGHETEDWLSAERQVLGRYQQHRA